MYPPMMSPVTFVVAFVPRDVLGGAPGVFSARWCGRHGDDDANLRLLLAQIADVDDEHRGARFTCAAVLVRPGAADDLVVERSMEGRILRSPRGGGGFGYDPVFVPAAEDAPGGAGRTIFLFSPAFFSAAFRVTVFSPIFSSSASKGRSSSFSFFVSVDVSHKTGLFLKGGNYRGCHAG